MVAGLPWVQARFGARGKVGTWGQLRIRSRRAKTHLRIGAIRHTPHAGAPFKRPIASVHGRSRRSVLAIRHRYSRRSNGRDYAGACADYMHVCAMCPDTRRLVVVPFVDSGIQNGPIQDFATIDDSDCPADSV
jgi:hypothetical protein